MSSKKRKMSSKSRRASEEPSQAYDHGKFINESAVEKFGLVSANRSFIKEKGFQHPDDFFQKTIARKGAGYIVPTPEAFDRLHEHPNYQEVLRLLTNR